MPETTSEKEIVCLCFPASKNNGIPFVCSICRALITANKYIAELEAILKDAWIRCPDAIVVRTHDDTWCETYQPEYREGETEEQHEARRCKKARLTSDGLATNECMNGLIPALPDIERW